MGQGDTEEIQRFLLEGRAPGQHGEARPLVFSRLHHVFDEGSQIVEESSEGLHWKTLFGPVGAGFLSGRLQGYGRRNNVFTFFCGPFPILLRKQEQ